MQSKSQTLLFTNRYFICTSIPKFEALSSKTNSIIDTTNSVSYWNKRTWMTIMTMNVTVTLRLVYRIRLKANLHQTQTNIWRYTPQVQFCRHGKWRAWNRRQCNAVTINIFLCFYPSYMLLSCFCEGCDEQLKFRHTCSPLYWTLHQIHESLLHIRT